MSRKLYTVYFNHKCITQPEVTATAFKNNMYVKFVCIVRPNKAELNRTQLKLGIRNKHTEHLMSILRKKLKIWEDCTGIKYSYLALNWNYKQINDRLDEQSSKMFPTKPNSKVTGLTIFIYTTKYKVKMQSKEEADDSGPHSKVV